MHAWLADLQHTGSGIKAQKQQLGDNVRYAFGRLFELSDPCNFLCNVRQSFTGLCELCDLRQVGERLSCKAGMHEGVSYLFGHWVCQPHISAKPNCASPLCFIDR